MKTVVFDMHGIVFCHSPDFDVSKSGEIFEEKISRVLDYYKKDCKVVFVSTSEADTSKNILECLLEKHKIESEEKIIASFDILNMDEYGSKKDANAWKAVLKPYKNITDIYEDKDKNLKAAGEAARQLGSSPRLHISVEK